MWVTNAHSCVYENMALPEHPGQGGLDFGGNHFIITQTKTWVPGRPALFRLSVPRCHQHSGAVPAQSRGNPAITADSSSTAGDLWVLKTLFISETQSSWSFLPNVAILCVTEGNSPPPYPQVSTLCSRDHLLQHQHLQVEFIAMCRY